MNKILLIIIAIVVLVLSSALYTLDEKQIAIKLRLGEVVSVETNAGLKFKTPFVNNIVYLDKRIQTLDEAPDLFLTGEKKNLLVDSYIKWKINNAEEFYKSTGGDVFRANNRLSQITTTGLKDQFSQRTIAEVVSGERNEIMQKITDMVQKGAKEFGIQIIDVRIKRIDFPQDISKSVYDRMSSEREREAKEHRSQGQEEAEKIRAEADKKRTIILADAYRDSEKIRGDGDAISASNYATAYNKNADFYGFYRSLESYKKSFNSKNDILVLDPNTEFFQSFSPEKK
jgi:membrane protease subunit HflC